MVQEATIPLSTRLFSPEKLPESHLPSKSTNLYIPLSGLHTPKNPGMAYSGGGATLRHNCCRASGPEVAWGRYDGQDERHRRDLPGRPRAPGRRAGDARPGLGSQRCWEGLGSHPGTASSSPSWRAPRGRHEPVEDLHGLQVPVLLNLNAKRGSSRVRKFRPRNPSARCSHACKPTFPNAPFHVRHTHPQTPLFETPFRAALGQDSKSTCFTLVSGLFS